jgi:hypothetical protein
MYMVTSVYLFYLFYICILGFTFVGTPFVYPYLGKEFAEPCKIETFHKIELACGLKLAYRK